MNMGGNPDRSSARRSGVERDVQATAGPAERRRCRFRRRCRRDEHGIRQIDFDLTEEAVSFSVENHLASAFDFQIVR